MFEILPGLIDVALLIFCLIDCVQTDPAQVRNLPKVGWIVLIVLVPFGGIVWLFAGRPRYGARTAGVGRALPVTGRRSGPEPEQPSSARIAQELDEQLKRDLDRVDREHEEALRRWQAQQERGQGTTEQPRRE